MYWYSYSKRRVTCRVVQRAKANELHGKEFLKLDLDDGSESVNRNVASG